MIRSKTIYIIKFCTALFAILILISCEKEEIPVPIHKAGGVVSNSVNMKADYRFQIFFDLETNSLVQQNLKTDWDLGFESTDLGNKIILNSSKLMYMANTNNANFSLVNDTAGLIFKWDASSGNLDSTAVGDWNNHQNIYVVDRGFNELGIHLGYKKIHFQSVNGDEFKIRFSNLDGSNEKSEIVTKNEAYNFSYLSFELGVVNIAPQKDKWDISFTQYTHIFDGDPPTPYLVSGVLTNRTNVEVARVSDKIFGLITKDDIDNYSFSTNIDQIGYDWKEYNFSLGNYTIFSEKNYIIKSTEGKYYKLHFIDFYDNLGEKGTPTFEFQEL